MHYPLEKDPLLAIIQIYFFFKYGKNQSLWKEQEQFSGRQTW